MRVSGKHNDLDDVGRDTYPPHHVRNVGNWSFGDYFQKSHRFCLGITDKVYKIRKENLYVTILEGDASENLGKRPNCL